VVLFLSKNTLNKIKKNKWSKHQKTASKIKLFKISIKNQNTHTKINQSKRYYSKGQKCNSFQE
jgi:hypothetical protein